jgi:hypothetical protein
MKELINAKKLSCETGIKAKRNDNKKGRLLMIKLCPITSKIGEKFPGKTTSRE